MVALGLLALLALAGVLLALGCARAAFARVKTHGRGVLSLLFGMCMGVGIVIGTIPGFVAVTSVLTQQIGN